MQKLFTLITVILLTILVGCQRGCTISKNLRSESISIERNGEFITLTATLKKYRNSKISLKNKAFKRKVTYSHGILVSVTMNGFHEASAYSEGVSNPDNVDLNKKLKQLKVKLSKNKNHLAIGVDQKLARVFHLLKDRSIYFKNSNYTNGSDWNQLFLDTLPTTSRMMLNEIENNCRPALFNSDEIALLYDDYTPESSEHQKLLNLWPDCSAALNYYTRDRVQEFRRNPKWTSLAVERALYVIGRDDYMLSSDEFVDFVAGLNEPEINNFMDEYYVENWGKVGSNAVNEIVLERLNSANNPFSTDIRAQIVSDAHAQFSEYIADGIRTLKRKNGEHCLAVLLASGDTTMSNNFLQRCFLNEEKYRVHDVMRILELNVGKFTSWQRSKAELKLRSYMKLSHPRDRSYIFSSSKTFVTCALLREWLKSYPTDLGFAMLPANC